jgi:hypothetical protein
MLKRIEGQRLLTLENLDEYRARYNRVPFAVEHTIRASGLFALPRLAQLGARLSRRAADVYYDVGSVRIDQRFDEVGKAGLSVEQAIARVGEVETWVVLKRIEQDPEYAEFLHVLLDDLAEFTGEPLRENIRDVDSFIFITSPRRTTAYHIDPEVNFLLQVAGEKRVHVFDPSDRTVLTEEELEAFYSGDASAARYRPEVESRAFVFDLRPGRGVHIPLNAPHWVENGDDVSISLSVSYELREFRYRCGAYRANRLLRRCGISPAPPGPPVRPTLRDKAKWATVTALERSRLL